MAKHDQLTREQKWEKIIKAMMKFIENMDPMLFLYTLGSIVVGAYALYQRTDSYKRSMFPSLYEDDDDSAQ